MRKRKEQVAALLSRGESERAVLARALAEIRGEVERRRAQWRLASLLASGLAAGATVAYRLFGKSSLSSRLGRMAQATSLVVGLARAALRLRRFW